MSLARRWLVVGAATGLAMAAMPVVTTGRLHGAPAQATEPYPTLPPTRPFPTLPSNVPSPVITRDTPIVTPSTATPTDTAVPSDTPSPPPTATATQTPTPTVTRTPSITPTPTATRYLDLGRVIHLPYAAQFAVLVPARAPGQGARGLKADR
jgi:hypothetical protein